MMITIRHVLPLVTCLILQWETTTFFGDKYKWSLRLTAINVTNKIALYNFLSTFSGTHFVTPKELHRRGRLSLLIRGSSFFNSGLVYVARE
jgi:hypothetical protein